MKKFFITFALILLSVISFGQSSTCENAVPFCTSMSYNIPLATNTTAQVGPSYDCLFTQPNPAWYYLQISNTGPLTVHMASSPGVVDIDFCAWGPFNSLTNVCNQLTVGNVVDCSYSFANTENCVIPNAVVGQFYVIVITNYGNVATNVAFSQTTGTGATDCTIIPPTCTTNAGIDQNICGLTASLTGDLTPNAPATSAIGLWSAVTTGTFSAPTNANTNVTVTTYNPFKFKLTETSNNACVAIDTVKVNFYEDPIYNFPNGQVASVCALSYQLVLQCTSIGTGIFSAQANTTGQWTWTGPVGALVTFTPNAQSMIATATVSLYGTYVFTYTGINGPCSSDASITVTFNANPFFMVNTTPESCVGSCDGTVSIIGAIPPYITNPTMPMSNLCAGNYSVTLTDMNGCSSQSPFTISTAISITHSEIHSDLICFNDNTGTIQLTTTGGTGSYSYIWTPPVSSNSQGSGLGVGAYSILVADGNGCNYTESITLTQPQLLTINATTTDSTICIGGSTLITTTTNGGNGTNTYLWNDLNPSANDLVSTIVSTLYQVVVKDINNCTATDQQMIYVSTQMVVTPTTTDVSCFGFSDGSVTLVISGGIQPYTYSWTSTNNTLTGLIANNYTVVVTDNYGCTSMIPYTINEPTQLTYTSLITQPLCNGQQGTIEINAAGGTPIYTYHWSNGYGNNIITLPAGDITLVLEDSHHCTVTNNFTITNPLSLTITGEHSKTICYGTSTDLYVNGMGGTFPYIYHWSTIETQPMITVSPLLTSQYTVTVEDANGCIAGPAYIVVNVLSQLSLSLALQDDTICLGNSARINADVSGGDGGPYMLYVNGEIMSSPIIVYPTSDQFYFVRLSDGCTIPSAYDTVFVAVEHVNVGFVADKLNGCEPFMVNFNNTSPTGYEYIWLFGDDEMSSSYCTQHEFSSGVYDITMSLKTKNNCLFTAFQPQLITSWEKPEAIFYQTPELVNTLNSEFTFNNNSLLNSSNYWSFGDGDTSNFDSPTHRYNGVGTYQVCLYVSSMHNCLDTVCHNVIVQDVTTFWSPNAFSPDNDGRNDKFKVFGYNINNNTYSFAVYDRWGNIMFETNTVDDEWDGKNANRETVPGGVYIWHCIYKDVMGAGHEKIGYVTVIR